MRNNQMQKNILIMCLCSLVLLAACTTGGKIGYNPTSISGLVSLDEALTGAKTDLSSHVKEKTEIIVASLETPLNDISGFLTDELTAHLVSDGTFVVLQRGTALEAVNAEHQFQMSGFVSDDSAVGIGHYLGAKVVITGSFNRFTGFSQLRLRAIDVRTSQLLTMYTARIKPDDAVLASVLQPLDNAESADITENTLAYLNRGEDLLREKKYDEAIREFDRVLAINKNLDAAYFYRGLANRMMGNLDQAIADYTMALRNNVDFYEGRFNRGFVYRIKGDFDRAIADFTAARRLKWGSYEAQEALIERGITYHIMGEYDRAIKDFNEVLWDEPDSYEVLNNRGNVYADTDNPNQDLDQAIEDYSDALRIKLDYYEALFNRGVAHYHNGDIGHAFADFNATLLIKPDYYEALYNRGICYYEKGDIDRAISDWNATLRINPNHAGAKRAIEIVSQQRGH